VKRYEAKRQNGEKVIALASKRRPKKEGPPWLADATRDDRGRVLPNLANLMIALRNAPDIADAFTYDEMLRAAILTRALPIVGRVEGGELGPYPRPVRDADVSKLQEWLSRNCKSGCNAKDCRGSAWT
jgi:hypothetical protein